VSDTATGRRVRPVVLAGVGLGVVAVAVAAVLAWSGRGDEARCERTAETPAGGVVESAAGGAQLVVGDVVLGIGGLSDDGCSVKVAGELGWVAVGERVETDGVPVMLLSVEPRGADGDAVGGRFEATFWIGADGA